MSVEALRGALSDSALYPHNPDCIEIEETHISVVAVVPPWVYKFKKPVDLGFLDFSTLEQRRHYCHEEVRLNRRFSPDIYEGVVPLVRTDDGLRVDPPGETGAVVEHAVKMTYVDPNETLEARIEHGAATTTDIDRVARHLCAFYRETEATPQTAEAGWVDRLNDNIDENFEQTAGAIGTVFSRPAYDALQYFFDRTLDQCAPLFHRRRAGGFVLEGHGDLRLDHVHLSDQRVQILDCIEFNERFRHLDVANDVAFLAMDLDVAGRSDLARRFVRRMADGLGDPELRALMPFYKAYRAHVRAKVEAIRAAETEASPPDRTHARALARRHAQWALRYAVSGGRPLVIAVMGRSATGKSTQAEALARGLGWAHVASDRVRKRQAGVPLHRRADAAVRKQLYTEGRTQRTYETLRTRALERGRAGTGTVLDATYSNPARRERLRSALRAADIPFALVELTASDETLKRRLSDRSETAPAASDARRDDFEALNERYEAPDALEDSRHLRIDADQDPSDTTTAVLNALIRLHGGDEEGR